MSNKNIVRDYVGGGISATFVPELRTNEGERIVNIRGIEMTERQAIEHGLIESPNEPQSETTATTAGQYIKQPETSSETDRTHPDVLPAPKSTDALRPYMDLLGNSAEIILSTYCQSGELDPFVKDVCYREGIEFTAMERAFETYLADIESQVVEHAQALGVQNVDRFAQWCHENQRQVRSALTGAALSGDKRGTADLVDKYLSERGHEDVVGDPNEIVRYQGVEATRASLRAAGLTPD